MEGRGEEGCSWCSVVGDETGEWDLEGGRSGEGFSCLICSPGLFNCCVPRECLLVLKAGIKRLVRKWKIGKKISVINWKWGQKSMGDSKQVFSSGSKDETRGLCLEEQKEKCGFAMSLFVTLAGVAIG